MSMSYSPITWRGITWFRLTAWGFTMGSQVHSDDYKHSLTIASYRCGGVRE